MSSSLRAPLALASLALAIAACVTPGGAMSLRPDQLPAQDGGITTLLLGPNDVLEVRVFGEPELSGIYQVLADGFINFPLCGRLAVAKGTPDDAAALITGCLGAQYVKRPRVTVELKAFNSLQVFIFGDVPKPGAYSYSPGMTIIHAVSLAGGFGRSASRNNINVTRKLEGKEVRVPVRVEDIVEGRAQNFSLQPGDIIFVPESIL